MSRISAYDHETFLANIGRIEAQGYEIVGFARRRDAFQFFLARKGSEYKVWAGCRRGWTIARFKRHCWGYKNPIKRSQTRAILLQFEHLAGRGWKSQ